MRDILLGAWALACLAGALALGSNHLRGMPIRPWEDHRVPQAFVALEAARNLRDEGALFVDARDSAAYAAGHVAGAVRGQPGGGDRPWRGRPPRAVVVVYCDGRHCGKYGPVVRALHEDGYERVLVMPDGWPAWQAAGYPTTTGPEP